MVRLFSVLCSRHYIIKSVEKDFLLNKTDTMSYYQLTIPQIKDELRSLGIRGYSLKNKDDLVAMLEKAKPYTGALRVPPVRPVSPVSPVSPRRITSPQRSPQRFPLDSISLVVFDFDLTVTGVHTCGEHPLTPEEIAKIPLETLLIDSDIFRRVVDYLLQHGKKVAIASYGNRDVIFTLMDRLFGDANPFNEENVITPRVVSQTYDINWRECMSDPDRPEHAPYYNPADYTKTNMLDILARRYHLPKDEILLIDDTKLNVDRAVASGYRGIAIPPQMSMEAVQKFRDELVKLGIPSIRRYLFP